MPNLFSTPKPAQPAQIATREDPSIANARRTQRFAAKRRQGRAATILSDQGQGQLGDAQVNRPGARQTTLG